MSDDESYSLFSGLNLIESIRDSGYKNTAYALSELIDNSIDAGAKRIEVICNDKYNDLSGRYNLEQLAIFDNGKGMDQKTLRSSLLFGVSNCGVGDEIIGRYGMGLPNSSLSQCKRVEVFTWKNSSDPYYSYIDIDEMKKENTQIPKPIIKQIPDIWKQSIGELPESGTLVIWNKLDRCTWKTSKVTLDQSELLIGRVYRKFLVSGHKIGLNSFKTDENEIKNMEERKLMLPNDPLYLLEKTSTPGDWGKKAMFKPDSKFEEEFKIPYDGRDYQIKVKYALVKDEVRDPKNNKGESGSTPHGKHARRNLGVSIVRAKREIDLDTNLTIPEPTERWWGVEINVPVALDQAVGLTNNKQHTVILSDLMNMISKISVIDGDEETKSMEESLELDEPTKYKIYQMLKEIDSHIRSMRKRLRASSKGARTNPNETTSFDNKAQGAVTATRDKTDKISTSDNDIENLSIMQRTELIANDYVDDGLSESEANERANDLIRNNRKFDFVTTSLSGSQFFDIQNIGGLIRIKMNNEHKAYKNLLSLTDMNEHGDMDYKKRFELANDGLRLLLGSWAMFEDYTTNNDERKRIQNIRLDWGKYLDTFLEQNEN